jgi:hypothetical protein
MYVPTKTLPDSIRKALRSVGYGKADIDVKIGDHFMAPSSYGAGHRAQVIVVDLVSGRMQHETGSWGGQNIFQARPVDEPGGRSRLPPGFIALTSGMTGIWHLHVHPENAAKFLPEAAEVTPRQKWILYTFNALTSAGRKNEWDRAGRHAPHPEELQELLDRGLLKANKAGAMQITTDGKNVFRGLERPRLVPRETVTAEDVMRGVKVIKP